MKRHLKEFIVLIAINLFSLYAYSQVTIDDEYVRRKISSARKQLNIKQFEYDCNTHDAILEINKRNISGKIDKDTLRKTARKYFNYDYNIEFIEIELEENDELNIENIRNKHADLYDVLKNPQYDKIGYNIIKNGIKNKIQFIVSENYIEFDLKGIKVFGTARTNLNPGRKEPTKIQIKGKSNIDNVFYAKINSYSDLEKINAGFQNNKLLLNSHTQFQIETELDYRYLVFYDSSAKILSVFNYYLNE